MPLARRRRQRLRFEPLPIVPDHNLQHHPRGSCLHLHFAGMSMFERIGQRFFDHEENIVPHLRRQRLRR